MCAKWEREFERDTKLHTCLSLIIKEVFNKTVIYNTKMQHTLHAIKNTFKIVHLTSQLKQVVRLKGNKFVL